MSYSRNCFGILSIIKSMICNDVLTIKNLLHRLKKSRQARNFRVEFLFQFFSTMYAKYLQMKLVLQSTQLSNYNKHSHLFSFLLLDSMTCLTDNYPTDERVDMKNTYFSCKSSFISAITHRKQWESNIS